MSYDVLSRSTASLGGALLLLGLAGCGEEVAPEKPAARPVKTLRIGDAGAQRTLEYPGQVEAVQHAELGFEVSGRIVEFPVDEGQLVAEGELLAKLDPRDFEAGLDAQRAQVRAAQAEFGRVKTLFDREVTSAQELDRARRTYEVTQAKLRTAEKAVEDADLRAPFAGVVARKLVKDFRNVQAKEPVLVLQDDSSLQLVVAIPEGDWVFARRDLPVEEREKVLRPRVTVSNYPDQEFPATVREVATTADPATRTFDVTLAFSVPDSINVLPGMTAKGSLDVSGSTVGSELSIPAQAVVQDQGAAPYVWRVDPEAMTVSRVDVDLGEFSGDQIEVKRGLSAGDEIAVSGVHQLSDGMTVRRFE